MTLEENSEELKKRVREVSLGFAEEIYKAVESQRKIDVSATQKLKTKMLVFDAMGSVLSDRANEIFSALYPDEVPR